MTEHDIKAIAVLDRQIGELITQLERQLDRALARKYTDPLGQLRDGLAVGTMTLSSTEREFKRIREQVGSLIGRPATGGARRPDMGMLLPHQIVPPGGARAVTRQPAAAVPKRNVPRLVARVDSAIGELLVRAPQEPDVEAGSLLQLLVLAEVRWGLTASIEAHGNSDLLQELLNEYAGEIEELLDALRDDTRRLAGLLQYAQIIVRRARALSAGDRQDGRLHDAWLTQLAALDTSGDAAGDASYRAVFEVVFSCLSRLYDEEALPRLIGWLMLESFAVLEDSA